MSSRGFVIDTVPTPRAVSAVPPPLPFLTHPPASPSAPAGPRPPHPGAKVFLSWKIQKRSKHNGRKGAASRETLELASKCQADELHPAGSTDSELIVDGRAGIGRMEGDNEDKLLR